MENVLTVDGLCKRYKQFQSLNGLSMRVPKGSIYGLIGKNGAGKTTLIRLICALQQPSGGSYALYGVKNTDARITAARRRMGAVVETASVYLDMTAQENMMAQYRVLGAPSFEGIQQLLELVGLADTGKKLARDFSLGMRQRLGIAVALAGEPDFLVLDEPINGLDPQGIIEIRELIQKLNRDKRITVLISSHYLDELSRIATHYGFIDKGRMIKEISAEALKNACRTCMRVEVSDGAALRRVLDAMQLEYEIVSSTIVDLYAKVNITGLVMALAQEHCDVRSLSERDGGLERYYVDLMGGDKNA